MSCWLVAFQGLYNLCCEEKSEYAAYAADVMAAAAKLRASLEGAGKRIVQFGHTHYYIYIYSVNAL